MAKQQYKGSLSLEWYNKNKSIIMRDENAPAGRDDIPAPKINWINKDQALFYEIDESEGRGIKPYWVDRNDIRVKETRPLIFQKAYNAQPKTTDLTGQPTGYDLVESDEDDPSIENILIRGDNLLALNTLKKMFDQKPEEEKVKCIYIDPPFNTESSFENYDDNLAHSEWLTMFRDRVVTLKDLLRDDGLIFVHIDYREMANLKILMDEIFGSDNCLSIITLKVKDPAGVGQQNFLFDVCEYILVYAKNSTVFKDKSETPPLEFAETNEKINNYNKAIVAFGTPELIKEIERQNVGKIKIYKCNDYKIKRFGKNDSFQDYVKHFDTIFADYNPNGGMILEIKNEFPKGELSFMEYIPTKGRGAGQLQKVFFFNQRILAWLKNTAKLESDKIVKQVRMTNNWQFANAQLFAEGGVDFKQSKKPESLIQRIIEISTNAGDYVLDCFAGSGTTLAVSHKLNRKWIGVELGKHADTHIEERLKNVLTGSDQSGISKVVDWQGGGLFKYYHLGPSIIEIGENGKGDFNWQLGRSFIEESLLSSYDYVLDSEIKLTATGLFEEDTKPKIGTLQAGTKTMAAVCSLNEPNGQREMMNFDEIEALYKSLKTAYSPEFITIFTNRGVEMALDSKPEDLEIIKVPYAIFAELEK